MKKNLIILLILILLCLLCLSSCDNEQKPTDEITYTVTEEQWVEILQREIPADNATITTTIINSAYGDDDKIMTITKLDLKNNKIALTDMHGGKLFLEVITYFENGMYYECVRDWTVDNAQWIRKALVIDAATNVYETLKDIVNRNYCYQYVNVASGNYTEFKYDSDAQEYFADAFEGLMAWKGGIYGKEECSISNAKYKFENGELVSMQYTHARECFSTQCKDYGTTVITIPTEYVEQ